MNKELIKQIAERTEKECSHINLNFAWEWEKKFAELIVHECLIIVENNNPRPPGTIIMYNSSEDEHFDNGWQVAVETKTNQIKKHFGVEE